MSNQESVMAELRETIEYCNTSASLTAEERFHLLNSSCRSFSMVGAKYPDAGEEELQKKAHKVMTTILSETPQGRKLHTNSVAQVCDIFPSLAALCLRDYPEAVNLTNATGVREIVAHMTEEERATPKLSKSGTIYSGSAFTWYDGRICGMSFAFGPKAEAETPYIFDMWRGSELKITQDLRISEPNLENVFETFVNTAQKQFRLQ